MKPSKSSSHFRAFGWGPQLIGKLAAIAGVLVAVALGTPAIADTTTVSLPGHTYSVYTSRDGRFVSVTEVLADHCPACDRILAQTLDYNKKESLWLNGSPKELVETLRFYVNGVQQGPDISAFSQKDIIASGGLGCEIAAHKLYTGYYDALQAKEKTARTKAEHQALTALENGDFKCDQTMVQAVPPMVGPKPVSPY